MIIGNQLGETLKGFSVCVGSNTIPVQYTFDDQNALDKFLLTCDIKAAKKFPLIFCVTDETQGLEELESTRQIVILTNTNPDWLSKQRTKSTFKKVIHPIYKKLLTAIDKDNYLSIVEDLDEVKFTDKSNFGIIQGGGISKKITDKSAVKDYVDARVIKLTLKYKKPCCKVDYIHKKH